MLTTLTTGEGGAQNKTAPQAKQNKKGGASPLLKKAFGGHSIKRPALCAFLLAAFCAALFVLPFVLRRGGSFYVSNDQITQQMPLYRRLAELVHSGQWKYDFNLDLGTGVIEGYAWYNLGSVFMWLQLLFPPAATSYLLGPMIIIKFAAAACFACIYLRRFTKTDIAAVLGGLLYAFCGTAVSNMVFPFEDMYALFPLLPLGMEKAMEGGAGGRSAFARYGFFAVAVALNTLVNPTFFFGAAVFMVLYFVVRTAYGAWRLSIKSFLNLAVQAVLGVGLSGALLFPFVASLLANPRLGVALPFGAQWLLHPLKIYFEILRGLILPPEVLHLNSMMELWDMNSPEFYLPLFGTVPVFAFMLGKKKHWVKGMLLTSLVFLLVPVLNSVFNGFNAVFYTRWNNMPMLFCALATVLCLEDESIPLWRGFALWGGLALAFGGCMALWCTVLGHGGFITYVPLFAVNLAICAAGLLCTALSRKIWAGAPCLFLPAVMVFAVACGGFNLLFNQQDAAVENGSLADVPQKHWGIAQDANLPEGVYRVAAPVSNMYLGHGSPFSFNSTVSPGVFDIQAAFGRNRTSLSKIEYDEPGLWALFGVEYIVTRNSVDEILLPNAQLIGEAGPFYNLFYNPDALPMVLGFTNSFTEESMEILDNTQKSTALLHGLVLGQDNAEKLPYLEKADAAAFSGDESYAEGVAARKQAAAHSVSLGNAELAASITMPQNGALLITLPYDKGWRCTINGQKAQLVKADWGICAVSCPAGEITLKMQYTPPGQTAGVVVTIISFAGILANVFLHKRVKRKRRAATPK